jgi:hypothetical protein
MPPPPKYRPKLPPIREREPAAPSAPDLAGLFPSSAAPAELQRASHSQAAFLWHYTSELTGRVEGVETTVGAVRTELEDFRLEWAQKEADRERKAADKGSVRFWFAWLVPVAGGVVTAVIVLAVTRWLGP